MLGELDGFPNASMDVVLDIRERIGGARTQFRAAIAKVAEELAAAEPKTLDEAVHDLRVQVTDPALERMRVELEVLIARQTLLRLTSDRIALATTTTQLSLMAGGISGVSALAHGLLSAPLASSAAKEVKYRSEVKTDLRLRPYWLLHEAGSLLRSR